MAAVNSSNTNVSQVMANAAALIAAKKQKEREEAMAREANHKRQLQQREMTPDNLRIIEQKLIEFQQNQQSEEEQETCNGQQEHTTEQMQVTQQQQFDQQQMQINQQQQYDQQQMQISQQQQYDQQQMQVTSSN